MKVILLQDVAKIGKRHQVVEVKSGYALNQLIPKRLAEPATPANLRRVEAHSEKSHADHDHQVAIFTAALEQLAGTQVPLTMPANAEGKLFEAIKAEAIVAAAKTHGATLLSSQVVLATPIKAVGEHTIMLQEGDLQGELTIVVNAAS